MQQHPTDMTLISCSYAPDLQRCRRLCDSVDRWVSADIRHLLIVPARDRRLFSPLANNRRDILCVEDVVPGAFRTLPFGQRWWIDANGWPLRGWIMQQLTKLSANHATDCEHLVFADSDLQFLRPFGKDTLLRDGALRLHRVPGAKDSGEHLRWHHRAARLLGRPAQYFGHDYIGQLISWRRSHLEGLQAHLEATHGRPWQTLVGRSLRVSEYILYGAYIDAVVGLESSGHFASATDPCHCCWFRDEADALASGRSTLRRDAVALLLQSNLGLTDAGEARILEALGLPAAPVFSAEKTQS